jgi:hypothetical protein
VKAERRLCQVWGLYLRAHLAARPDFQVREDKLTDNKPSFRGKDENVRQFGSIAYYHASTVRT